MEPDMLRTQIQLTDAQSEEIRRIASHQHKSMAEIIRQGLDFFLRSCVAVSQDERIARARAVSGRFRSGSADGSTRHDDHLAAAYRA